MKTPRLPFSNVSSYLDLLFRWYVCSYISVYGTAKLFGAQFGLTDELMQTPVGELTSFQLTWAFFGHSYIYGCIIGSAQVIGGLLLLHPRSKLIGVAILLPILSNIIMVDVFYEVNQGALINAIVYLCMLLFILFYEREKVQAILQIIMRPNGSIDWNLKKKLIQAIAIALGGIFISYILMNV